MPEATTCPTCGGSGWKDSEVCPECLGDGASPSTSPTKRLLKALAAKVTALEDGPASNVFWSYKIWEATDLAEFMALSDSEKDSYRGIVRMGTVSLVAGSHSKTTLWGLFGSETDTRIALEALIT